MRMFTKAFQQATEIIDKLEKHGFEAYFVGGCVRDLLLHRNVGDIDIATAASPEIVQELFPKVIPVGIEHGTVIVRHKGESYEITTFRKDGDYSDQRHPDDVTFINNIDDDLKRRDFTINALAMDKQGKIIDLFSGKKDLDAKIIRSVGNPRERFMEDPLRIIRGLRFASQLGFAIETETLRQMKFLINEIETVAIERLTNEFSKIFQGEFVQNSLNYLIQIQGLKHLPIFCNNETLIERVPKPLTAFYSFAEVIAMFHYLEKDITITDWVKAWKCSNQIKRDAINIYEAVSYFKNNGIDPWLVYRLDFSNIRSFNHLIHLLFNQPSANLEILYDKKQTLAIQTRNDLKIDGHDILKLFPRKNPGSWMQDILETVEYKVVMNELINNNQTIKEWIKCHPPETN